MFLICMYKIWSPLLQKKGSTTVFMGKQTGDDCEITLVLQLLSEKWKLVNSEKHL